MVKGVPEFKSTGAVFYLNPMSYFLSFIILLSFWLLLSGEFTPVILTSAVVACALVAVLSHDLLFEKGADLGSLIRKAVRYILYTPWLIKEIVIANIDVARRVLSPSMPIDPCIIKFKTDLKTNLGITTLSNSITLTPGTVTLSANKNGEYIVHALSREFADGLLSGEMQKRVQVIEDA